MSEHPDELVDDTPNISRADAARLHLRFGRMLIMAGLLRDKLNLLFEEVQCLTQQQERTGTSESRAEDVDGSTECESGLAEEVHSVDQHDGVMSAAHSPIPFLSPLQTL